MTKHFGFTLAEVLITLGIIGVVAAMTMPTLINQTRGAEFRAGFKKTLSVLSQAAALNQALDDWDFGAVDSSSNKLEDMLDERINVISKEEPTDYSPNPAFKDGDGDIKVVKPGTTEAAAIEFKAPTTSTKYVTMNDGSMFIFDEPSHDCTQKTPCFGYIDVNGAKRPNKITTCDDGTEDKCYVRDNIGDIFPVYFYEQTVLPASYAGNAVLADKTKAETPAE